MRAELTAVSCRAHVLVLLGFGFSGRKPRDAGRPGKGCRQGGRHRGGPDQGRVSPESGPAPGPAPKRGFWEDFRPSPAASGLRRAHGRTAPPPGGHGKPAAQAAGPPSPCCPELSDGWTADREGHRSGRDRTLAEMSLWQGRPALGVVRSRGTGSRRGHVKNTIHPRPDKARERSTGMEEGKGIPEGGREKLFRPFKAEAAPERLPGDPGPCAGGWGGGGDGVRQFPAAHAFRSAVPFPTDRRGPVAEERLEA
jgi:hypothetical protein